MQTRKAAALSLILVATLAASLWAAAPAAQTPEQRLQARLGELDKQIQTRAMELLAHDPQGAALLGARDECARALAVVQGQPTPEAGK